MRIILKINIEKSNNLYYRDQLNNCLHNSIEMTSELEEAIGLILKGNYLSKEEMYELTEKVDLNLHKKENCTTENIFLESNYHKDDKDNNNNSNNDKNKQNKNNELIDEIIMKNNFNYPLFLFYQKIFHERISHKDEELSSLRFQHKNIIQKTAQVCSTYSPYQFIFHPNERVDRVSG